jgi:hypothetical protein
MYIERSGDGGRTWPKTATKFAANSNTPKAGCIFQDKEYITTDPRNDNVYASWTNYHLGGAKCDGFDSSPVLFVRSTDGAKTFSKPVLASGSAKVKSQGSIPKVAPDGTIYVAYDSLQSGVTDICPTYSVSSSGATGGVSGTENVMVARSTNEGRSFSQTTAFKNACDVPYPTPTGGTYRQNSIPTFAIDPTNGTLVVAWPNQDISQQTIHVRVSKNGGKTWTDGQTLAAPGDAYQYPWLAFGADGRLYMTYLNQQPGGLFNAFLVVSKDDGKTWSQPDQLSNAQSFGDDAEFEGQFDGDYLGMAVGRDNVVHPVWTDIRNAFPTGTQNIWTKALRY